MSRIRRKDSTKTRVAPAFDVIANPKDNHIQLFIDFVNERTGRNLFEARNPHVWYDSSDGTNHERKGKSPVAFLETLVGDGTNINWDAMHRIKNPIVKAAREDLKDAIEHECVKRITEGNRNLGEDSPFIFEGKSSPDVCIETDDYFLLIEGKRTEPTLTQHTLWVKDRDQLIRHIDAFLDNDEEKPVYGMYIIEADMAEKYKPQLDRLWDFRNYKIWMPHRSYEQVKDCYLGHVTWEALKAYFKKHGVEILYRDFA